MSPPPTPSVSVIVPTHNRRSRLPALIDAIAPEPVAEIVIVANGEDDGSSELLAAMSREDSRIKPLSVEAADKPTALQRGIEEVAGDVVLLLDDDVLPEPGLASGHAAHHALRQGLLVVGYMPVEIRGPRRPGQFAIDLYSRAYERVCAEYEADPPSILQGLWGGNLSLRREDALRVGFRSRDSTMATQLRHEDREFGLRCADRGMEAIFDRELRAAHHHQATLEGYLRISRNSGRSRWLLHQARPEAVGELAEDFFSHDVPMPGRALVRVARLRWAQRPVQATLRATLKVAGLLRLFRLECHAGWLMGTVEQQRGGLEAAGSLEPEAEDR